MWTFETPIYLFFLFAIPVAVYFRHFWKRRGGRLTTSFDVWEGEPFIPANKLLRAALFLTSAAFWLGCAFYIIALGGPAETSREKIYLSRGMDIMIVLDESPSMSAKDFEPENRFQAAKDVIRNFVSERENDAIGIVTFGKEAALRVPPTVDHALLLQRLDELQIMDLGDGTAIGMGIAVAALHLDGSTAENRAIILLTDGENNAGEIPPEAAADIAASMGIRVYAIGIGTEGEVPIEYVDPNTGKVNKGIFVSRFDEELLSRLAKDAGGRYFPAINSSSLGAVFRTIDSIETVERRVRTKITTESRHRIFIAIGLALILFSFFVRRMLLREVL